MLLTKEIIYDRIKDSGYPFWSLYLQQGFKNTSHLMTYTGNDFEDEDSTETKLEKSVTRLDNIVTSIPNATFIIEIKNAKTANGNGIIGPLQFSNTIRTEEPTPGLPASSAASALGTVQIQDYDSLKKQLENEFELKIENFKQKQKQEKIQEDLERKQQELEEKEKELKDLKKGYESGVAKTADILVEAAKRIALNFFPDFVSNSEANNIQLSGNQQQQQQQQESEEEENLDEEKAAVVNQFAEYLYKNFDKKHIEYFYEDMLKHEQKATEHDEFSKEEYDNNEESEY